MSVRHKSLAASALAYTVIVLLLIGIGLTHSVVRVDGGSMHPALQLGDLAVIAHAEHVSAGEIVLFRSGQGQVLHRVERIMPGGRIVTRGDANPVRDVVPVSPGAIKGRVVAIVPVGQLIERWH